MSFELVFSNPLLAGLPPVKNTKTEFEKLLNARWSQNYNLTYLQAVDCASIWEDSTEREKRHFCKKLKLKFSISFKTVLKQIKKEPRRTRKKFIEPSESKDIAKAIETVSRSSQLFILWSLPELNLLKLSLGLDKKSSLVDTLTQFLQMQNFSHLGTISTI